MLSPSGELVTTCVKTFPFLPYEVDVSAGDEACVFDVPGVGRFGIHICYDLWFPESSRELAMNGAEVILHPSLTDTCDRDVEKAMAIATAAQQQCYGFCPSTHADRQSKLVMTNTFWFAPSFQ